MQQALVLGIGNTLLSDEGVGPLVVQQLAELNLPESIRLLDGGTLSFTLAPEIEAVDYLLVIDCTRLDAPPGTVRMFVGDEMDAYLGTAKGSVHEVGLTDLLDIARLTDSLPAHRALIGIQPLKIDWGEVPSPEVQEALPKAVSTALEQLKTWGLIP